MQRPGIVFSRQEIMERVWGIDFTLEIRTVDMHVKTLRQKLGEKKMISSRLFETWAIRRNFKMQVRIRMSLIYVGVLATIFAVYFSVQVFEETMEEQLQNSLRQNAHLIEAAYN